jgi:lipopolysaccharide/colanic/teichoic acid biosynthesis glycosyltransferase
MNVLYVGNESNLIHRISQESEISLIVKTNGLEALKKLEEHEHIDIICVEYNLPGNDGLYFLKKVKSLKKFRDLPCILLQSQYSQKVFQDTFSKGINDYYVLQPHSYEKTIERIKSLFLEGRKNANLVLDQTKKEYRIPWSKRLFDIIAATSLLILLSPILLITILAIRLESKGKVYYTSKRVGRKTFDFYKFRSMRVGSDKLLKELAEKNNQYTKSKPKKIDKENDSCPRCDQLPEGEFCSSVKYDCNKIICDHMHMKNKEANEKETSSFIKIVHDPRITKIGKIIRNTSIDELPQLINVIKGDMSLVGNRPLPVYEAEMLTKDQLSKRFLAPAGITGLWQVELRGKGGEMSEAERIELDNKYADYFTSKNYSFWFDIKIVLRTVPALFQQSAV